MTNETLGKCACPICEMSGAAVRVTGKGKAYILCEECGCQIFARGFTADKKIRERVQVESTGLPAPLVAPIPEAKKPAEKTAPKVTVRTHSSDGGTVVKEVAANDDTIFDKLGRILG